MLLWAMTVSSSKPPLPLLPSSMRLRKLPGAMPGGRPGFFPPVAVTARAAAWSRPAPSAEASASGGGGAESAGSSAPGGVQSPRAVRQRLMRLRLTSKIVSRACWGGRERVGAAGARGKVVQGRVWGLLVKWGGG